MTTDGAESWTCSSWPLEGKYRNSKVVPFVKMRKRKAFMVLQISRETTYLITQYSGTTMAAWNTLTGRMELNALQERFDKCLQMFWCFCTHESATIGICYNEVNSSWPVALFSVNKETTNSCLSHPRWMNDTQSFFSSFFLVKSYFNEPIWTRRRSVSAFSNHFFTLKVQKSKCFDLFEGWCKVSCIIYVYIPAPYFYFWTWLCMIQISK